MGERSTAVLVFDGFADWEPAFALTGLRQWGKRAVTTVGYSRAPVTSMGGLTVVPGRELSELDLASTELLLLPGGDAWTTGYPADRIQQVVDACVERGVPVAGICAATVALARAGMFRGRRHTSNGRDFLAHYASGYETPDDYVEALAVSDRGVISASGLGAIEFAAEIFTVLGAFDGEMIAQFRQMHRSGKIGAAAEVPRA
jgi:putative intracellular protease/amidase